MFNLLVASWAGRSNFFYFFRVSIFVIKEKMSYSTAEYSIVSALDRGILQNHGIFFVYFTLINAG